MLRLSAAAAVLIRVAAFFPSCNLVDGFLQFVQVGGVGVVGEALCVSEEFNLTLTPLLLRCFRSSARGITSYTLTFSSLELQS